MRPIDLWFSNTSTYTYLTMMRLKSMETAHKVQVRLRPFYLGLVMEDMGHVPFVDEPPKLKYMWRDIERRALSYGLRPKIPAPFPSEHWQRAQCLAHVALKHDWGREYVVNSFRNWFESGNPVAEEPNLSDSLNPLGQSAADMLSKADDSRIHEEVMAVTREAQSAGVFGSPTFAVGEELFWGDDRMEDAFRLAKSEP